MEQSHDDQDAQEEQEGGVEDFADPSEDLPWTKGEKEGNDKEQDREQEQIEPGPVVLGQDLFQTYGEGGGGAAGDSEKGADGQVQQAGEEHPVGASCLAGQVEQAGGTTDAQGGYAQQGHPNAGDEQPHKGQPYIAACVLSQGYGEDQVACAEEHTEEHTCHGDIFPEGKLCFHMI